MTREFPDELLSAYLDNELPPADRSTVEKHLAKSEADSQLLSELKSLRSELGALPRMSLGAAFTDRVVQAALSSQAVNHGLAPSGLREFGSRTRRSRVVMAAASFAAALAASLLLILQPWRRDASPPLAKLAGEGAAAVASVVQAPADQVVSFLGGGLPSDSEAVVLRLQVGKDVSLSAIDAALAQAGIQSRLASDVTTGASNLADTYRQKLADKYGPDVPGKENTALVEQTIAVADAVFVEAPLAQIQGALTSLADAIKQPLQLGPETRLTFAPSPDSKAATGGRGENQRAAGEPGSASTAANSTAAGQPFAQHLSAGLFRLEKKAAAIASALTGDSSAPLANAHQPVRVLILIEQVDVGP